MLIYIWKIFREEEVVNVRVVVKKLKNNINSMKYLHFHILIFINNIKKNFRSIHLKLKNIIR